jgi:hypothetical protein
MAKIQTEIIVVKLSKLIKDTTEDVASLTNEDFNTNLEAIIQELVGDNVLVEIEEGGK